MEANMEFAWLWRVKFTVLDVIVSVGLRVEDLGFTVYGYTAFSKVASGARVQGSKFWTGGGVSQGYGLGCRI